MAQESDDQILEILLLIEPILMCIHSRLYIILTQMFPVICLFILFG